MRILQVSPRYAPNTGGVETQVQALSERLAARGHEVTVVTADADGRLPRSETRCGVEIRRCRGVSPGGAFHAAPGVAATVRRIVPDIVHAHNVHSFPLVLAALGAHDARFVATAYYHGTSASRLRAALWTAYRPLAGVALRRADAVTAVSDWECRQLRTDFGVDAERIPIGVETETFASATPCERNRPYLLCVARLEEYKGIQHAIRALSVLEDYDLLIAGDGPYEDELKGVASHEGVADRVTFLGTVDHHDLAAYYTGATAYISLSAFESYGLTVGEALASGTPCVVRDARALGEWASVDGCVATADTDPAAVASAVRAVEGAPVDATAVPSWEEVTDRFCAVYET